MSRKTACLRVAAPQNLACSLAQCTRAAPVASSARRTSSSTSNNVPLAGINGRRRFVGKCEEQCFSAQRKIKTRGTTEPTPEALVLTAKRDDQLSAGFQWFTPWVWAEDPCNPEYCDPVTKICSRVCGPVGEATNWYCQWTGSVCLRSCPSDSR